jgi:hypothetical protein
MNSDAPVGLEQHSAVENAILSEGYAATLSQSQTPYLLMADAHSGGGAFDYYVNRPRDMFEVDGVGILTAAQFGNFLVGFGAGYLDDPVAYWLGRGAGSLHGLAGSLRGTEHNGEWQYWGDDDDSVLYIDIGLWYGKKLHERLAWERRAPATCR